MVKTKGRPLNGQANATEAATAASTADSYYRPGSKVVLTLKEDGSIDLDSMRDSTQAKLKEALGKTPAFKQEKAPTPDVVVEVFHPEMVKGLYSLLGSIESMMAQKYGKISPDVARKVFAYTDPEIAALKGPTVRIMNKYAADWMIKYQDEITLFSLLGSMTVAKVNAAIALEKMKNVTPITPKTPPSTPQQTSQAKTEETPKKEGIEATGPN